VGIQLVQQIPILDRPKFKSPTEFRLMGEFLPAVTSEYAVFTRNVPNVVVLIFSGEFA
jgi:hypothetical protein